MAVLGKYSGFHHSHFHIIIGVVIAQHLKIISAETDSQLDLTQSHTVIMHRKVVLLSSSCVFKIIWLAKPGIVVTSHGPFDESDILYNICSLNELCTIVRNYSNV